MATLNKNADKAPHNLGGHLECDHCASKDKGVFCELQGLELKEISDHKVTNTYKKGQTLFVQGNPPFGLFCISSGNIKLTKVGPDGKETIIKLAKGGDVLGQRSLFTQTCYSASATALEDTTVCFLDKKFIMQVLQKRPQVAKKVIEHLSKAMGAAEDRLASMGQKTVKERFAELLLLLKESHGEISADSKIKINIRLTREEMANMIGTAPETLIRIISEFKDRNILEQVGKTLVICKEQDLLDEAGLGY